MDLVSQNLLLSSGGKKASTYVDDVFSTYLYKGNETARSINNGVDNTKGGMVWVKNRDNSAFPPYIYDTERGVNKQLRTSSSAAETTGSDTLTSFNNDGITIGNDTMINRNGDNHVAWNFRKAKGFFDIVTYTGNGANRTIDHSLGCIPGSIWIKQLNGAGEWINYHCGIGAEKFLQLNNTEPKNDDASVFQDTEPTASVFSLGTHAYVNGNGNTYVAYLFAGNLSDSVEFDGTDDFLTTGQGNMWTFGTNDFTVECWVKFDNTNEDQGVYQDGGTGTGLRTSNWGQTPAVGHNGSNWIVYGGGGTNTGSGGGARIANKWYHVAHVRYSGTTKLYVDGVETISFSDTYSYGVNRACIGGYYNTSYLLKGNITNFRLVKHRAVYTSNFTPPTTPLGKTYDGDGNMDTFLLCCNKGSPTGYTIDDSGNGMSSNGDPQQSSDVPSTFGELTALFGEDEDKSIIKCGSYVGKSGANTVNLTWEPEFVIVKNVDSVEPWVMVDSMRRWANESSGVLSLKPSSTSNESTYNNWGPTATGWQLDLNNAEIDQNEKNYIYIAIRRSTGQVGKPAEAGTDVFAMDTGAGSSTIPNFDSGFPVDFAFYRSPSANSDWITGARLISGKYLHVNNTDAASSSNVMHYDSNVGWNKDSSGNSSWQSWMWKRHAGFDVVTWKSGGSGETHFHGLGKAPEMIWIKNRSSTALWRGGHKGLNGGTNPWTYGFTLNNDSAEFQEVGTFWNGVVPSATSFSTGSAADAGGTSGNNYIAMLFDRVDGISKVGYYTGTGNNQSVTTGFQPRFILIKRTSYAEDWFIFDSLRGLVSGSPDPYLRPNQTAAQITTASFFDISSTGFTVTANFTNNANNYIYYAHA